jgi:nuclear pore complex protein Nup98-Nup96
MFGHKRTASVSGPSTGLKIGTGASGSGTSFSFGGGNTTNNSTGGGLFGNSSNQSGFGQTQNNTPGNQSSGFSFGAQNQNQQQPQQQNSGSSFSIGGSANASGGGLFGKSNSISGGTNTNTSAGGLFGGGNQNTAGSGGGGGLFGQSNNNSATGNTGGGLFGGTNNQSNTNTGTGGGLFGANNQSNANTGTGGGMFGTNNQSNASTGASGGLFGQSNTNTGTSSGGLFGNNTQNTNTAGGGLFGGGNNTTNTGTSGGGGGGGGGLFGNTGTNTNTNATGGGSLFGGGNTNAGGGLFGGGNNANTGASAGGGLFGNKPATNTPSGGGGLFGGNNTATPSGGSLFGGNSSFLGNTNTPQNSQLGASGGPSLVASIDQAPYSVGSLSSHGKSLGPLTSSTRKRSSNTPSTAGTPTIQRKASMGLLTKSHSLKAMPSPRSYMSAGRSSPYQLGRRENQGLRKSQSLLFQQVNARDLTPPERSMDDLRPKRFTDSYSSDVKRLIINRKARNMDSIFGKSPQRAIEQPQQNEIINGHAKKPSQDSSAAPSVESSPRSNMLAPPSTQSPFQKIRRSPAKHSNLNQMASKDSGYWMFPSLSQLYKYTPEELTAVANLTIGRRKYGQITYNSPVDLSKIGNLSDIPGNLVVFGNSRVCVYPDEENKPPRGQELNIPATITLENAVPVDKTTKQQIRDPEDPRLIKHVARLRNAIESKGGEFVTYDIDNGFWTFRVPHFSVWGLLEEDLYDDDEDEDIQDASPQEQQQQPQQQQFFEQQQFQPLYPQVEEPQSNNLFADNKQDDTLQRMGLTGSGQNSFDFSSNVMEDTFGNKVPTTNVHDQQQPISQGWGLVPTSTELDTATGENNLIGETGNAVGVNKNILGDVDFEYSDEGSPTRERGELFMESNDNNEGDKKVALIENPDNNDNQNLDMVMDEADGFVAGDWLSQLQYAARMNSPLALRTTVQKQDNRNDSVDDDFDNIELFTTADLDAVVYGGLSSLGKSSSLQYRQAAEQLRLPELFTKRSFARFNAKDEKILVKDQRGVASHTSGMFVAEATQGNLAKTNITDQLTEQLRLSKISIRDNGLPLSRPNNQLSFKFLYDQYSNGDEYEKSVWELASILFDNDNTVGIPDIPYDYSEAAQEKIKEQHRRKLLSKWLERRVSVDVDRDLEANNDDFETILLHLSGHRVQKAAEVAVKNKNLHLATVIPLLGGCDESIRQDAASQLESWNNTKSIYEIPQGVRKVYEYLSGNVTIAKGMKSGDGELPTLYLSEGLDWKRALGLRLWYESNKNESISQAVEKYYQAFSNAMNRVAQPLAPHSSTKIDICYQLLRLYGSLKPSLVSVLEPIGKDLLDCRVPWLIYSVLVLSSRQFRDFNKIGDRLSIDFGCQLDNEGKWIESLFVLSHIQDDNLCDHYIKRVLSNHILDIQSDPKLRQQVTEELKISKSVVHEVEALRARYDGDHLAEVQNLLQAGQWEEAHQTLVKKVAPEAVIQNKTALLIQVLNDFKPASNTISNWEIGGQVYLDYASLVENKLADFENEQDVCNRLVNSLSQIKVQGNRFAINVACSLMAKFVGKRMKVSLKPSQH